VKPRAPGPTGSEIEAEHLRVGLCVACRHARRLVSAKGSVFYRCGRAQHDARYPDYPPLPVRACAGFASSRNAAATDVPSQRG
jgi:hypothetical protein